MKALPLLARYMRLLILVTIVMICWSTSKAQTTVLDPNDPIVIYNPAAPPATPPWNTLAKWVKTTRLSWNSTSLKCYYFNGIPFRLKYPKNYSTAADGKKYPLYVFFHGIGEKGTVYDNEYSMAHGGDVLSAAVENGKFDGFLLYPQSTSSSGFWNTNQYAAIYTLINNYLITQAKVDPNRIIVNGLSGGGDATWAFLQAYPKLVAAAVPMSNASTSVIANMPALTYNPIWLSSGALDNNPAPSTATQVANAAAANGNDFRSKIYPTLAHNVWDSVWKEPDFFPYISKANKTNPWTRFGRTEFCPGDPINVTIGVTAGFDGYQWRKNGAPFGGNSNTINATEIGTYDCRILRGSTWSDWSVIPVVIKLKQATVTPDIQVWGLSSNVLPAPDGKTTVTLSVPTGYTSYVWQKLNPTTTQSSTSYLLVNATPGDYQVRVAEQYGCSSAFSNTFTVVNANGPNPPVLPTNFQANNISQTQIKLTWNEGVGNPATQFEVYQALTSDGPYTLIGFTGAAVDSFVAGNLEAKTRYYYKVRAINTTAASAATQPASALTPSDVEPPTPPSNLTIGLVGTTSVELSWEASTDNVKVTNYDVFVNGSLAYSLPGDATSYTVYNLANGQTYAFVVKARDNSGNVSSPSNQVVSAAAFDGLDYKYYTFTGTWNNLPNFATLIPDATGNTPNVTIANRDQDDNFAYLWEGFIQIPVGGTYTFRTNSDDGSRLYLGAKNQSASPYNFGATSLVNNDGLHGTQDRDGTITLTAGVYPIAITFYEQGGGEAMTVSWRTPQTSNQFVVIPDSVFAQKVIVPGTAPAAPSALVATAATAKKINLAWQDNSNNETGFEIYRSTSLSGDFSIIKTVGANAVAYADSSLQPSTTYYYKIRAVGNYGQSSFDAEGAGVSYDYYETNGINNLPTDFSSLVPKKSGRVPTFGLGVQDRGDNFMLKFSGNINITTPGSYTFFTSSDDGSKLYIGALNEANRVVDNDLPHGTQEKQGSITLAAGSYPIFVTFFENGGGEVLEVRYQGPGIAKQLIPGSVLGNPLANATTQALPALPAPSSNLVAVVQGANKIDLTWTNNGASVISGIELWRSPINNANYELVKVLGGNPLSYSDTGLIASTAYYYKVRAINEAGKADYSDETSASTNANPPSVVTLPVIPNQTINNDSTVVLSLNATTDLGSSITYSATGLPSFGTLVVNPNSTGTLTLAPKGIDLGNYSVTVTATDNYLHSTTRTFSIVVNGKGQVTINVNFNQTLPQASPWNNTSTASTSLAGLTRNNLLNTSGVATSTGINFVNNWTYSNTNGMVTGNNTGVFPDNVLRTCYINYTGTATQFKVTGLSSTKKYSIVFFGGYVWTPAQLAANGAIIANYTIGAQTVTLDAANNTSKTVRINGISPDATGNINVSVLRAPGSSYAILNAIQIISYDVADNLNAPYNLTASGSASDKVLLKWEAPADVRTGFEIWRNSAVNGTYSLVNTVAGSATSYTDNGLTANTTYFYKVRAVNNAVLSGFSNVAGGSTVSYIVNLQFNSSPNDAVGTPDWNSTNFRVAEGFTMENLKNTLAQGTGIGFVSGHAFNNVSTSYGVTTGNNSGPVPDAVMKTTYFVGYTITVDFSFTGLNRSTLYNMVFYGGNIYNPTGTTVYKVGDKAVTLNTLNNTTQVATLYSVKPDENGTIKVEVYSTQGYGWMNSVTLQAMTDPAIAAGGMQPPLASADRMLTTATLATLDNRAAVTSPVEGKVSGFPNPFIDDVTLTMTLKQNTPKFTVLVSDLNGRMVYKRDFNNIAAGTFQQRIGLNGSSLSTGTYVVQVIGIEGEKPRVFKLVKIRK